MLFIENDGLCFLMLSFKNYILFSYTEKKEFKIIKTKNTTMNTQEFPCRGKPDLVSPLLSNNKFNQWRIINYLQKGQIIIIPHQQYGIWRIRRMRILKENNRYIHIAMIAILIFII